MKFDKLDWFLLLIVIVVSVAVYALFSEKVPFNYLIIIILVIGLITGILRRAVSKKEK
ncbi:hypothetical protein VBD025_00610 [Virgibacillus flavescens]|uniref:hypothetical protein n=1 Tax=Virgibacillus flavescens TaxID=1611422 RepID=UPI003D34A1DC